MCSKLTSEIKAQEEQQLDTIGEASFKNITDLFVESRSPCEGVQKVTENTQLALQSIQTQLNESYNLQLKSMDSCCETSWKNLTELLNQQVSQVTSGQMDIKFDKLLSELANKINKNYRTMQGNKQQLVEHQRRSENKTLELETEMKTSIERLQESNNQILTQQTQTHNQFTELTTKTNQTIKNFEILQSDVQQLIKIQQKSDAKITTSIEEITQLSIKIKDLQSGMATKTNQPNKNFEKLQSDVQQIAEIQQQSDKKTLEAQAEMKKSIERNQESSNQIFIQANKNIEALQTSVQQLVDDNQKMRAVILNISGQLTDLLETVLTDIESRPNRK
jgi:hypothetical protein